jgi:hypothetical protein
MQRGNARLDIASGEELDDVEAYEHHDGQLPGLELHQRKQRREDRREQRADERDVVEDEGDHSPGGGELDAGHERKAKDHDASHNAHRDADQPVLAEFYRDIRAGPKQ